jgi:hypothetical protein
MLAPERAIYMSDNIRALRDDVKRESHGTGGRVSPSIRCAAPFSLMGLLPGSVANSSARMYMRTGYYVRGTAVYVL